MLQSPAATLRTPRALIQPALDLRDHLAGGHLLTPWARDRCGQEIRADVQRARPLTLDRAEAALFGLDPGRTWECLRRIGYLVQADGAKVARITSLVPLAPAEQADSELVKMLNTTDTPLGTLLGGHGRSQVAWCSAGIGEYAVGCERTVYWGNIAVARTTDWVLWSWLAALPADG